RVNSLGKLAPRYLRRVPCCRGSFQPHRTWKSPATACGIRGDRTLSRDQPMGPCPFAATATAGHPAARARCQVVRSSTWAVGAFSWTDSIPFSIADVDEYIWLRPSGSPFAAMRTKSGWSQHDVLG